MNSYIAEVYEDEIVLGQLGDIEGLPVVEWTEDRKASGSLGQGEESASHCVQTEDLVEFAENGCVL
jgi:hypothetical protein